MFELAAIFVSVAVCAYALLGAGAPKRARAQEARRRALYVAGRRVDFAALAKGFGLSGVGKAPGEADVPAMLDIVTLGLEAGLSFDASVELYCERFEGRLSEALKSGVLAWRLGALSRAEALRLAARQADAPSLKEVAGVVEEALDLGLPLSDTLTRQADAIRSARRALVEERIERVPVKMLIPLGTLIVPAMLLAILGPLLGSVIELG